MSADEDQRGATLRHRKDWDILSGRPYRPHLDIISKLAAFWARDAIESGDMGISKLGREWGIHRAVLRRQIEYQIGRKLDGRRPHCFGPGHGSTMFTRAQIKQIQQAPSDWSATDIRREMGLMHVPRETINRWRFRKPKIR